MGDIGKGDWVLCIAPGGLNHKPDLVVGNVYYVDELWPAPPLGDKPGAWICYSCKDHNETMIQVAGAHWLYCPKIFKPLKKPPAESTSTTKTRERETEDA